MFTNFLFVIICLEASTVRHRASRTQRRSNQLLSDILMQPLRSEIRQRLFQYIMLLLSIIVCALDEAIESDFRRKPPEPYHTSILSGHEWVMELLTGHPERIHCELGMHAHVFKQLILELRDLGHTNSKFVSLEEQLAIFLYCCVTGLSIRHVGERFQRSNDTISRYVLLNIIQLPMTI